jgi:FkbM family methyltransferase
MLVRLGNAIGDRFGRSSPGVRLLSPLYTRWLHAAYGRRGVPWSVNGEPLRIDPSVRHLVPRENERPLFDFLRSHIRPGDVLLDIGAFLGTYAVMTARWAGEWGRVIAFEPCPATFAVLKRHLAMNGLGSGRVEARCVAVGSRPERRRLITFPAEPYRNLLAPADAATVTSVAVDVVTVDHVCSRLARPPNWIRMDVQGLEFEVLAGLRRTLQAAEGRLHIVAEVHPDQWPEYGVPVDRAADRFAELGFRVRPLESDRPLFEQGAHVILEPIGR